MLNVAAWVVVKKKKTVVRRNEEMEWILQSPILLRMGGVGWSVRKWVVGLYSV